MMFSIESRNGIKSLDVDDCHAAERVKEGSAGTTTWGRVERPLNGDSSALLLLLIEGVGGGDCFGVFVVESCIVDYI